MKHYSAPGKVFVLGEYAVLAGQPALVAAVGPRFRMTVRAKSFTEGEENTGTFFHPQSPVARLIDYAQNLKAPNLEFSFSDPHAGAGGFGASTAQFALVFAAFARELGWNLDWMRAWKLYRELTSVPGSAVPPSGADLVAQFQGGVSLLDPDKTKHEDVWGALDWSQLLVFSATQQAGRKVETHTHLKSLEATGLFNDPEGPFVTQLKKILGSGLRALKKGDAPAFGAALNAYAEALAEADLEIEATRRDRLALRDLPGVLGVKGTGAGQADAVIVLLESVSDAAAANAQRKRVIEVAEARGLRLTCDGVARQDGVVCPEA